MFVDPDEQFRIMFRTDVVRDTVRTVLGQALFLGDDLQAGITDSEFHVKTCCRAYSQVDRCCSNYCKKIAVYTQRDRSSAESFRGRGGFKSTNIVVNFTTY